MDRWMRRLLLLLTLLVPLVAFSSARDRLLEFTEEIPQAAGKHIAEINRLLNEYRFDELEGYAEKVEGVDPAWKAHIMAYLSFELMQEDTCYETASRAGSEPDLPDSIRSKWLVIASRCFGISQEEKEETYRNMFSFGGMGTEYLELAIQDLLHWAWRFQLKYISQGRGSFQDSVRFDRESENGAKSILIGSFRVGQGGQITDDDILAMFPSREMVPDTMSWLSGRSFKHGSAEGGRVLFFVVQGLNHNKAKQAGTR